MSRLLSKKRRVSSNAYGGLRPLSEEEKLVAIFLSTHAVHKEQSFDYQRYVCDGMDRVFLTEKFSENREKYSSMMRNVLEVSAESY